MYDRLLILKSGELIHDQRNISSSLLSSHNGGFLTLRLKKLKND